MKATMKAILAGMALAVALGVMPLSAGKEPLEVGEETNTSTNASTNANTSSYDKQECVTEWNNAPAGAYCAHVGIGRVQTQEEADRNGTTLGHCVLDGGRQACPITAVVQSGETTFGNPMEATMGEFVVPLDDVDTIDICFAPGNGWYTATVKVGCDTDEITSAAATSTGLPELQ